ncbi:MAG: ornithine cyclodeaminase family protein [Roseobacter sp.]
MFDLDKSQIMTLFDFDEATDRIRDAYVSSAQGTVQTGDVVHLTFPDAKGDCHVKSGHIAGTDAYVVKIASGFYDNPTKGLPSSNGMMLAFCATTGAPLAILRDEGWLTDMRTAIGGALATRSLARVDATNILIIGAGIQAKLQALCLAQLMPERTLVFSIWARNGAAAQTLVTQLKDAGHNAVAISNLDDAIRAADCITTTTPATEPLFADGLISKGTHVTAIGADCPGKQELPSALVATASLRVCDLTSQSLNHGEFQTAYRRDPSLNVTELGHIFSGAHPGRVSENDITVADLTGIAAQDIAITQSIIDAALRQNTQKDIQ